MERELLIEIGCEELPAAWLPKVTLEFARQLEVRLSEARIPAGSPLEAFSTPRRLVVTVAKLPDHQSDVEELITGPAVAAAYTSDGAPTKAATGFARKYASELSKLIEVDTPKGRYLAYSRHQTGAASTAVLPAVLAATLRDLNFPKQMQWDAALDDGHGELMFGRPIRWILFLFGGQVVPFEIGRTTLAEYTDVEALQSSNFTYGHRFLGKRASEPIKVKSIADYRAKVAERFVVLDHTERQQKVQKALLAKAEEHSGSVDLASPSVSALLEEVSDLVEWPQVVEGRFDETFLELPREVLTTTLMHHQHFFPLAGSDQSLLPVFLAVTNTAGKNSERVSRNAERVIAARLRDARFFWEADREILLESRLTRLDTLLFHKRLGSYREKSERIEKLAGWIVDKIFNRNDVRPDTCKAARLAKADLVTEMVGEFGELQGIMGGIYALEQQLSEPVWKAIYYHYLPVSPEPEARPTAVDLGTGAVTWAAVALADKLDTIVGLFSVGERPTGSRDPFGLRRQAHGIFKILLDLPELTGMTVRPSCDDLLSAAALPFESWKADANVKEAVSTFMLERLHYVLDQRGHDIRNVRAVIRATGSEVRPLDARGKLEVLPEFTESSEFKQLAMAFKRVRNIARDLSDADYEKAEQSSSDLGSLLTENAERHLLAELEARQPVIEDLIDAGEDFRRGFTEAAKFGPAVNRFFSEVFVMADDPVVRVARLRLMKRLERLILQLADISEIVVEAGETRASNLTGDVER